MKSKSIVLLAVSLGFGLVAAFGISQVIGKSGGQSAAPVQRKKPVIVAKMNLDIKSKLTEENVTLTEWPEEMVPEDAVTSFDDLKQMLTKSPIYKDQPVMHASLVHKNDAGILNIAPGHTVVSINVAADDTIGGLLQAGDRVDLMAVFQGKDGGLSSAFTRTFLKNVKIFAVGKNTTATERGDARGESIVSVEVTKKNAEKIVLVQQYADIKMTLVSGEPGQEADETPGGGTGLDEILYGNRNSANPTTVGQRSPSQAPANLAPADRLLQKSQPKQYVTIHTSNGMQKYEWKDGETLPVLVNPIEASQSSAPSPLNGPPASPGNSTSGNTGQSSPESKSGSAGKSSPDEFVE